jgi:hypothetical protein
LGFFWTTDWADNDFFNSLARFPNTAETRRSPRGCYELAQESLANAENGGRQETELIEQSAS